MSMRHLLIAVVASGLATLNVVAVQSASAAPTGGNESCTVNLSTGAVVCDEAGVAAQSMASAAGLIKLVTIYEDFDYEGKSLTFVGPRPCSATTSDVNYVVKDLRNYRRGLFGNWNDKTSSVVTYNRCDVRFFA